MFSYRPPPQGHQDLGLRSEALTPEKDCLPPFPKSQFVEASEDTSAGRMQPLWPAKGLFVIVLVALTCVLW